MTTHWFIEALSPPTLSHPKLHLSEKIWGFLSFQDPIKLLKKGTSLLKEKQLNPKTLLSQCQKIEAAATNFDSWATFKSSPDFWILSGLLWQKRATLLWKELAGHPIPEKILLEEHTRLCGLLRWKTETCHPWHLEKNEALNALKKAYSNFDEAIKRVPKPELPIVWKGAKCQIKHQQFTLHNWLHAAKEQCFNTVFTCPWKEESDLQWCRSISPDNPLSELEYIEHLSQNSSTNPVRDIHRSYEKERHILDLIDNIEEESSKKNLLRQRTFHRIQLIEALLEIRRQKEHFNEAKRLAKEKGKEDSFLAKLFIKKKLFQKRFEYELSFLHPEIQRALSKLPKTLKIAQQGNQELCQILYKEAYSLWKEVKKSPIVPNQISKKNIQNLKPKKP